MKATELMIGDWLYDSKGIPKRVELQDYCDEADCLYDGLSNLKPIPLTEEILKANGFNKLDLTIGNYALKLEEKEKYDIHTILWGGVFNGRMEFKVICEYIHIDKKIRYVHELQHALRLCGLSELADNFKVE